ncbi:carbohydrate ABC transporter permease [Mangrovibacillus cuniculi]|uniref:Sugar ABC transporter permease n=1 Tax=Mangrovibacillus cuniculi TaxID=2593652 RepID=A0A7S8C939_9BACI|nr:sugar ABC transporter permease [Mangrovibacillus cuniculi]QPC45676.1 sugar ABC transporter permease [Mangrovibacillus cuniculi]
MLPKPETSPTTNIRKKKMSQSVKDNITGYIFVSPFFILFSIFGLFPMIFSFYLAFFKWNGLGPMTFAGLDNFRIIFADALFWKSIYNTVMIGLLGTVPQLIVAFLLAYALNSQVVKFRNTFRVAIFMPYVTSIVAVAILFSIVFNNQSFGLVNSIIGLFGYDPIVFTQSEWGAKIAIASMIFWRWIGYNTIIYLAGMQSISNELYEAAKMDGANLFQQLRYITIPVLKPFILFTVFMGTIGSLQVFTEPLIFFNGNLRPEGITVVAYLYRDAFESNFFGTASATAIVLFVLIMIFSLINLLFTNRVGRSKKRGASA